MEEVFHEAVKQLNQGDPVVMATVVHTKGSTPQKPGAKPVSYKHLTLPTILLV